MASRWVARSAGGGRRGVRCASTFKVVDSPYTGEPFCQFELFDEAEVVRRAARGRVAQRAWAAVAVEDRVAAVSEAMDRLALHPDVAAAISGQMGKPLKQAQNELLGMKSRAAAVCRLAAAALAEEPGHDVDDNNHHRHPSRGTTRRIVKEPVGTVLQIAPWNYPMLTLVNALVPALCAGNNILLKHSPRTPLCAGLVADAFDGLVPEHLVQSTNMAHDTCARLIASNLLDFVSFTGSVRGGAEVYKTVASHTFCDVTLELGGKDAAYVLPDADLEKAVDSIVDGATYNAGQSCCAVERCYVSRTLYPEFLERATAVMAALRVGDPADPATGLGPMALPGAPAMLRGQVADAVSKGARVLTGGAPTSDFGGRGRFFEPTLVADCDHSMRIMVDESFGPVLAVRAVDGDDEAVRLMNDSEYGLTASLWSRDVANAECLAPKIAAGNVYLNRCDFVDPSLPWGGPKNTGKGTSLSTHGFSAFTRLKGMHFKHVL